MKMANIDAVFDYNFTYPKTSDGVGLPQSMSSTFVLSYNAYSVQLWWGVNCCTLPTSVLVPVVSPSMCCGEESGTPKGLD